MYSTTIKNILIINVKLRLAQMGVTLSELCEKNAMSQQRIWGQINGNPTLESLKRIAKILNVPAHALLDPNFNPRDYR